MKIYYFRQPDKNKEEYFMYSNTSLTRVGEVPYPSKEEVWGEYPMIYTNWKLAVQVCKYLNNVKQ